jgi:hypothetical protein
MTKQLCAADDEALSGLLDDALTDDEAQRLRQRLARDPALAARLEALEKADAAVRQAYTRVADEPLPERLIGLLRTADDAVRASRGNVVQIASFRQRLRVFAVPTAIAASIALTVGLALGVLIGPRLAAPESGRWVADAGLVQPGTALFAALQTLPSTGSRQFGADLQATARFSFRTNSGGYCRQINLSSSRGTTATLACRNGDAWQVEVASFGPAAANSATGVYRPATGNTSALDGAIDELIDGEPLGAAAEQDLIERGWRPLLPAPAAGQ